MAKLDASPDGGLSIDQSFFPHGEQFRGLRVHQIRLKAATPPQTPTATADTRQSSPGCASFHHLATITDHRGRLSEEPPDGT